MRNKHALLLLAVLWTAACGNSAPAPSITFTKIPPVAKGGPDVMDVIEGRVTGARPGQRLVLYGRSTVWWVQPGQEQPFTDIRPDSSFSTKTHLGTEYAALLVDPDHQPPTTLQNLPREGGSVVRVVVVPGDPKAKAVRHTLQFAGYEWIVRAAPSDRGGPNKFDPSNAWTDASGAVHLRIAGAPGRCAGVGLLLLRVTVGVTVAIQAWLSVASTNAGLLGAVPAAALGLCGLALTIGLFTPVCSTLVGLGYALVLFTPVDGAVLPRVDSGGAIVGLGAAAALGLLGPGAFSIDCRLFGRREIFIPAKDDSD